MQRQVFSGTVEVPQIQFIARVSDIPVRRRDGYPQCKLWQLSGGGGDGGVFRRILRLFRAPPGCSGVDRQFSSPR